VRRSIYVLVAAVVASAIGYGISTLLAGTSSPSVPRLSGTSSPSVPRLPGMSSPSVPRFSFAQSKLRGSPHYEVQEGEMALFTYCPWPNGETTITVTQEKARRCDLLPGGRSFALLASPIGGASSPSQSAKLTDDVRFVHAATAKGVINVGPVLMEFGDYSGGARPDVVTNASTIWIFDSQTERGPEVLRISAVTGAILQRTEMPAISRPVMAVNESGFWMGQASSSLIGNSRTVLGVWLAPLHALRGVLVRRTNDVIISMASSGRSVIVDVAPSVTAQRPPAALQWMFTPVSS
jgi:hypothetical protein